MRARQLSPAGLEAQLAGFELVVVRMPLRQPWSTSAGAFFERESLLVRAVLRGPAGEAEGWGECPALAEPSYNSEYTRAAAEVSERFLLPALFKAQVASAQGVGPALGAVRGHNMAKTAFEAALADAELRLAGRALADHLWEASEAGLARASAVRAGVSVGLGPSIPAVLEEVGRYVAEGYTSVKLKVSPLEGPPPAAVLGALRERWPRLVLGVDANCAYEGLAPKDAARQLAALDELGLAFIEQPLGVDDLLGHARLARLVHAPICLDEALVSLKAVELALELGACSVVNLKAGRVGGYLEAVRVHDLCAKRGAALRCGGMVETAIGRAANVALASLGAFSLPGDLTANGRFFERDLAGPLELSAQGTIAVPTGPGNGVEVELPLVSASALWRRWYPADAVVGVR